MSATAIETNGKPISAVEYVRGLSPEEKEEILFALLREAIEIYGGKGLIPLTTFNGESLGYYVPPLAAEARAEMYLPKWTPEEEAELKEQFSNPGPTITADEWIAELKARAAELERQKP